MPRGKELRPGEVYGCYTVVREFVHGRHYGGRMYWCRCTCGHEAARYVNALMKRPTRCQKHSQAVAA